MRLHRVRVRGRDMGTAGLPGSENRLDTGLRIGDRLYIAH